MTQLPVAVKMSDRLPGRRLSRAEHNEQKRQLLQAAAWQVLTERGYQATTLEEIAERAGFTPRPIYTLFGSKNQLALELYEQLLAQNRELVEAIKPARTLAARLTRLADLATELTTRPDYKSQLELTGTLMALSVHDDDIRARMAVIRRRGQDFLTSWLEDCAAATGEGFCIPVERVARIIGVGLSSLMDVGTIDPDLGHAQLKRDLVLAFIARP